VDDVDDYSALKGANTQTQEDNRLEMERRDDEQDGALLLLQQFILPELID